MHADVYSANLKPDIILPRTDRLADYASIVSRLIHIFSEDTEKDEISTYRDLVGADRDIIRVRALGADDDGSLPLDTGVKLIERARDMLLAAACAVRAPQPLYRAGANREATEYMRRVKLGQTEHGSFIVTLLSPVPPKLGQTQLAFNSEWTPIEEEPIERQVTRRLVNALEASRNAAELAAAGNPLAFEEAVAAGVSANLCEAVADLIDLSQGLDVSVAWARTRPVPEPQRKVRFSQNDAEILREASRTFRLRVPEPDVTLYGTVHKLKRDHDEVEGIVTLKAIVNDKTQSVKAVLDQENYRIAVQAHEKKAPVILTGDLERVGERWQLSRVSVIRLISTDHDEDGE
ncbi:hypothetical protein [Prosthecomicrobium pneumaticum]|uniref:Uncharacterized protein n=1 Tax=Prosthecomicrobium pneumaticum TaxID=81895 RepID=A0A7W9FPI9_9HYPH|nr:hypothetical protein [Prosthecomicrobium pneumaticum]MBB5754497.1 hypothetical protein [Prosthecomicrobium pneumaticum]